jgi:hypothetical protein
MSLLDRIRRHHTAVRNARSIDRALRGATTQAMRDEILLISQRHSG